MPFSQPTYGAGRFEPIRKSQKSIVLGGYQEERRGLWQIPEAAAYIRQWATEAGLTDYDTARGILVPPEAEAGFANFNCCSLEILTLCGVFGEDRCQLQYLARRPT